MVVEDIFRVRFRKSLQMLAPGTDFRQGIENVIQAKTGALIVVGDSPEVMGIASGGFHIDCEFTPAACMSWLKWTVQLLPTMTPAEY